MIAFALACTAPLPSKDVQPPDGRPDILILTIDTLRADHVGFAGHDRARTPRMDALASRSMVFDHATTPFPRTTPALASMLTGLRPVHHGSHEVAQPMSAESTLARTLQGAGYRTIAVSAIGVASPEQNLDRGFSSFTVRHDARATEISRVALELLSSEGVTSGQESRPPLFLWVHYADPHFPYLPANDAPVQPDAPRCRALGERAERKAIERALLFSDRDGMASSVLDECVALYDAEIAAVDEGLGILLDGLATTLGDRPRYTVLSADHGEHLGEDALFFEHGPSLHDAVLRIPMVIGGPGITAGRDFGVARLEDLAPTLLDLVGLPPLPEADGRSLAPRLTATASDTDPSGIALIESGSALHLPLFRYLVSGRGERFCLNEGPWSLCKLGPKQSFALYNHDIDPRLTTKRNADEPEQFARFTAASARWKPEQARRYEARSATHSLRAYPKLDGGYSLVLTEIETGKPTENNDITRPLTEALRGMQVELPLDARTEGDENLLRDLGYLE